MSRRLPPPGHSRDFLPVRLRTRQFPAVGGGGITRFTSIGTLPGVHMPILLPKNLNDLTCLDPSDSRGGSHLTRTRTPANSISQYVPASRGRAGVLVGYWVWMVVAVRLCDPCLCVRPCVPCVSRLPPVSF